MTSASVKFTQVTLRYAVAGAALSLVTLLLLGAALLVARALFAPPLLESHWVWWVWGVLVAVAPLSTFAVRRSTAYALREHDFHKRRGVFFRTHTIQPLARMQHIKESHGPVDRALKLATLTLFSAGQGSATFVLPGLDEDDASTLRETALEYGRRL